MEPEFSALVGAIGFVRVSKHMTRVFQGIVENSIWGSFKAIAGNFL
jgi:hypothetical protein